MRVPAEEIISAFAKYKNTQYDIVGWDQNPHLQQATYLKILQYHSTIPMSVRERYNTQDFIRLSEFKPGLISRWPGKNLPPEDVSHDEVIGACVSARRVGYAHFPGRVLDYCRKTGWGYSIARPGKFSLRYNIARIPGVTACVTVCATDKASVISQLVWAISAMLTAWNPNTSSTSSRLLYWVQLDVVDTGPNFIMRLGSKIYKKFMAKRYPGGPKDVLAIYYKDKPEFAQYAPPTF